jgi:hypothetical protein
MNFLNNPRFYKKAAIGTFAIFTGIMIVVTFMSYNRRSGHTGMDMGKIQQMRFEASKRTGEISSSEKSEPIENSKQ